MKKRYLFGGAAVIIGLLSGLGSDLETRYDQSIKPDSVASQAVTFDRALPLHNAVVTCLKMEGKVNLNPDVLARAKQVYDACREDADRYFAFIAPISSDENDKATRASFYHVINTGRQRINTFR